MVKNELCPYCSKPLIYLWVLLGQDVDVFELIVFVFNVYCTVFSRKEGLRQWESVAKKQTLLAS